MSPVINYVLKQKDTLRLTAKSSCEKHIINCQQHNGNYFIINDYTSKHIHLKYITTKMKEQFKLHKILYTFNQR